MDKVLSRRVGVPNSQSINSEKRLHQNANRPSIKAVVNSRFLIPIPPSFGITPVLTKMETVRSVLKNPFIAR